MTTKRKHPLTWEERALASKELREFIARRPRVAELVQAVGLMQHQREQQERLRKRR